MKSVNIKLSVYQNVVSTMGIPNVYRIVLVYDAQTNGQDFSPSSFWEVTSPTIISSTCLYNIGNSERYKVLIDYKGGIVSNTSNKIKTLSFYKKINCTVSYGGTDSGIGDIQTGSLYLVIYSDIYTQSGDIGVNVLMVYGSVRIRYTDA